MFIYKNRNIIGFDVVKFVVFVSILMFLLVFGGRSVFASDGGTCFDVVKKGKEVLVVDVANSGVTIFDDVEPNAPLYQYQACLEDGEEDRSTDLNFGAPGDGYFQVKGWAWNDNLGWISFYCEDGNNLGVDCGTYDYGVTVNEDGEFFGYAWGENTGWISFNNPLYSQLKIETENPLCQGYVYGSSSAPDASCLTHTALDTMVWSDNVGWIDFDGVIFPWFQVTKMLIDAEVIVEITPDPRFLFKTAVTPGNQPLVANGSDKYTVKVTIRYADGTLLEEPRYETTIDLGWVKDTVKKDQRKGEIFLAEEDVCSDDSNRAVKKPCLFLSDDNYVNYGVWEGAITSVAPTSDMNGLIVPGTEPEPPDKMIFSYEKFVSPKSLTTGIEPNDLILNHVKISVVDKDNGLCLYGSDVINCTPKNRGFNGHFPNNFSLKFLPQTEITDLNQFGLKDYIDLNVNEAKKFNIRGAKVDSATVTLYAGWSGISDNPSNDPLKFVFANGESEEEVILDFSLDYTKIVSNLLTGGLKNFFAGIVQRPEAQQVDQYLTGLYIYSVVDEGNGVYYYSNKLPRVTGSLGVQPVAVLRGPVYSQDAITTTTTQGDPIRTMGDISSNLLRDQVFRNVMTLVAGKDVDKIESVTLTVDEDGEYISYNGGQITSLLKDSLGVPKVYFAKGDIHVGVIQSGYPGAGINVAGERTIISIGGNIYIDNNIYKNSEDSSLGLIALKDLTSSSEDQKKTGNIYILDNVNNVQANIFADGSVFTYYDGQSMRVDGRPMYVDEDEYIQKTKTHQLYIEGSVASANTIGGALKMIDGKGNSTNGDRLKAMQYDLNYLRTYTGLIKRDSETGFALDVDNEKIENENELRVITEKGLPWSVYLEYDGQKGHLWPPFEIDNSVYVFAGSGVIFTVYDKLEPEIDLGSTYIFYNPPSPTLPGFQGSSEFDISLTSG